MRLFDPVLFRDGHPVMSMPLSSSSEPGPVVAAHTGHFAVHARLEDRSHLLARDLLGVHKLFFGIADGEVVTSNYLIDLLRAGHPFESVFSVPAGHCVRVNTGDRSYHLERWGKIDFGPEPGISRSRPVLEHFAAPIRAALERTFRMLAERFAGRPVYVTLSGGLDSTTIAAIARAYFPKLRAVTFGLRAPRETGPGTDLFFSRRVAADLGIEHVEVLVAPDEVLALLDDVLVYGQDYRDFNVQCGLVNAAIGRAIAEAHREGPRPVVFSGDAMNELLADYAPVQFQGREYFGLPRIKRGRIRRFLVGGLESGDREVGIFARFGVETVQPYALCAPEYAALPSVLACDANAKSRLARAVMKGRIPEYVLARPKVRAQVAVDGEPGGTFALLLKSGIDQEHMKARFGQLFGIGPQAVMDLARVGHYRSSRCFPAAPLPGTRAGSCARPRSI